MKRILITGASGFIGHRLMMFFANEGFETAGWSRNKESDLFPLIPVDLNDPDEISRQLKAFQPEIIIHCAGSADVGKSVQDPESDYHGNVTITHALLFALHRLHMEHTKFIFLSSAGVYGNPSSLPITEDMPLNPMSPYAVHKVMCEDLCRYFCQNYHMDIKIARIFSAYGEGLKKQIFWDMFHKLKSTGRLDMFGTGTESRDYIHIRDVVQALFLLATVKSEHTVFNVANGEEITIRKAAEYFADSAKVDSDNKIVFNHRIREGDPLNWRADITRIQALGYKKTVEMADGIQEYYSWVSQL